MDITALALASFTQVHCPAAASAHELATSTGIGMHALAHGYKDISGIDSSAYPLLADFFGSRMALIYRHREK